MQTIKLAINHRQIGERFAKEHNLKVFLTPYAYLIIIELPKHLMDALNLAIRQSGYGHVHYSNVFRLQHFDKISSEVEALTSEHGIYKGVLKKLKSYHAYKIKTPIFNQTKSKTNEKATLAAGGIRPRH